METVTKSTITTERQFGGVPYGNLSCLKYTFETNASGILVNSDKATAIGIGDVVRLGILPAGFTILGAEAIVSDTMTDTITADVGFLYTDGVDDANVPQDANGLFASIDVHDAVARFTLAANGGALKTAAPITLPKDAYLVYTNNVAACAAAGRVDVLVHGIMTGQP
jgi:hypothetical protein